MRLACGALLLALTTARCDCGGSIVGHDAGPTADAATDATTGDGNSVDATTGDGNSTDAAVGDGSGADAAVGDGDSADAAVGDGSGADAPGSDRGAADAGASDVGGADGSITDATASDQAPHRDAAPLDARACLGTTCAPGAAHCHVCVDVLIDNFCNTSTVPSSIAVPTDSVLTLTFHNRSVDYAADIWSSMGYGFIELPTGASWDDPIDHCTMASQYREYFDVSIYGGGSACPGVRLNIDCQ